MNGIDEAKSKQHHGWYSESRSCILTEENLFCPTARRFFFDFYCAMTFPIHLTKSNNLSVMSILCLFVYFHFCWFRSFSLVRFLWVFYCYLPNAPHFDEIKLCGKKEEEAACLRHSGERLYIHDLNVLYREEFIWWERKVAITFTVYM